jgi:hypothetical protein
MIHIETGPIIGDAKFNSARLLSQGDLHGFCLAVLRDVVQRFLQNPVNDDLVCFGYIICQRRDPSFYTNVVMAVLIFGTIAIDGNDNPQVIQD